MDCSGRRLTKCRHRIKQKMHFCPNFRIFQTTRMNGCTRATPVPFANLRIVSMPAIAHPSVFSYYNEGEGLQNQLALSDLQPPVVFGGSILAMATRGSRSSRRQGGLAV